jgi:hypothetical protein
VDELIIVVPSRTQFSVGIKAGHQYTEHTLTDTDLDATADSPGRTIDQVAPDSPLGPVSVDRRAGMLREGPMQRMTMASLLLLTAVAVLVGCGGDGASGPTGEVGADPSFAGEIQPIFTSSCASLQCHGAAEQAGLKLTAGDARA